MNTLHFMIQRNLWSVFLVEPFRFLHLRVSSRIGYTKVFVFGFHIDFSLMQISSQVEEILNFQGATEIFENNVLKSLTLFCHLSLNLQTEQPSFQNICISETVHLLRYNPFENLLHCSLPRGYFNNAKMSQSQKIIVLRVLLNLLDDEVEGGNLTS